MTEDKTSIKIEKETNNICEECKKLSESVKSNLIMYGYKICDSCKISKTIFPIQKPLNKNKIKNKANACINQATITTPRAFHILL